MKDEEKLEQSRKPYSGVERTLGYRRTFWSEEKATLELDLDERHMNVNDMVHGGIYATMIDDATGYAVCWSSATKRAKPSATLALTVEFVGVPTTARIIATAWKKGGGASISFAGAEVRDSAGTLLATGGATYRHFKGPKKD